MCFNTDCQCMSTTSHNGECASCLESHQQQQQQLQHQLAKRLRSDTMKPIEEILEIAQRHMSSPNVVQRLEAVMRLSNSENMHVPTISNDLVATWEEPMQYIEIVDTEELTVGVFLMKEGAVIPLHDHPNMTVLTKILQGHVHVEAYDWVDDAEESVGDASTAAAAAASTVSATSSSSPSAASASAKDTTTATSSSSSSSATIPKTTESAPSAAGASSSKAKDAKDAKARRDSASGAARRSLSSVSGGRVARLASDSSFSITSGVRTLRPKFCNVHSIRALTNCAFLDATFPSYSLPDRPCTYYRSSVLEPDEQINLIAISGAHGKLVRLSVDPEPNTPAIGTFDNSAVIEAQAAAAAAVAAAAAAAAAAQPHTAAPASSSSSSSRPASSGGAAASASSLPRKTMTGAVAVSSS